MAAGLLVTALVLFLPVCLDAYTVIYDWNRDVASKINPPVKTVVRFDSDTRLDMVRVYHLAPREAIAITLKGRSGSHRVTNFAKVNAFGPKKALQVYQAKPGTVVKAGEYEVLSSSPSTWLYNAGTGNRGFLAIDGTRQSSKPDQHKVGDRLELKDIEFASDRAVILPTSYPSLNGLYNTLAKSKTLKVELRGHANAPGAKPDMKYAGDLGGRRAKAVSDYMVNKGIARDRVRYKGYGNTQ
ncbi:MAG: OmpA family protein, partial [Proteobacteria bacterium]|nr:OmpA family protein [Pseudomonadota bacterium]